MSGPDPAPRPAAPSTSDASTEPSLTAGLEALLFLADEPVDAITLADALEADPSDVEHACEQLAAAYEREGRGLAVRASAGGWRMYTAPVAAPVVERWALEGRSGRLTQAALETLAVVAYKQPISRQEISDIRGVSADGAVRSLVARGFVAEVGRDDGPGQAVRYGTTTTFLERLGLGSLEELPPLTEFLPEAPAPDEPELGSLKEVRKRLASGEDLPSRRLGGRSDEQTNTGGDQQPADTDDDAAIPPPTAAPGRREGDEREFDDLTERLDAAARSAVGQLRAAMAATAASDHADEPGDEAGGEADAAEAGGDAGEAEADGDAGAAEAGGDAGAADAADAEAADTADADAADAAGGDERRG